MILRCECSCGWRGKLEEMPEINYLVYCPKCWKSGRWEIVYTEGVPEHEIEDTGGRDGRGYSEGFA